MGCSHRPRPAHGCAGPLAAAGCGSKAAHRDGGASVLVDEGGQQVGAHRLLRSGRRRRALSLRLAAAAGRLRRGAHLGRDAREGGEGGVPNAYRASVVHTEDG